jgi:hypothetical protein
MPHLAIAARFKCWQDRDCCIPSVRIAVTGNLRLEEKENLQAGGVPDALKKSAMSENSSSGGRGQRHRRCRVFMMTVPQPPLRAIE